MILGLGGHVEIWAAQALPLGVDFPPLHPCWKEGQLAMFSRESEVWIFMHNPLILRVATNPPPLQKKKKSGTEMSRELCWNQPSVSEIFLFLA